MTTLLVCALALAAGLRDSVESRALRLVVSAADDLTGYAMDAEFAFRIHGSVEAVRFHFPGVESPDALRAVELDGKSMPRGSVSMGVHPRFGSPVFVLRPGSSELNPGDHTLYVRGPETPAPSRGLTRWGSWHPILSGGDVAIPIELEVHAPSTFTVIASGHRIAEHISAGRKISRWRSAHPQGWGGLFLTVGRYHTGNRAAAPGEIEVFWPENHADFDPAVAARYPREILTFFERTFGRDSAAQFRMVVFRPRRADSTH